MRTISSLYAPPRAPDDRSRIFSEGNHVEVSPDEYLVDDDVREVLKGYATYNQVNEYETFYPCILIEYNVTDEEGRDKQILCPYEIYKIVAGLPSYTRLTPRYKLSTVDHIHRDTRDNRRESLRYCTVTQNGWNKCPTKNQKGKCARIYHGVSHDGDVTYVPTNSREKWVWEMIVVWFNLVIDYFGRLESSESSLQPPQGSIFDPNGCVYDRIDEIPIRERTFFEHFVPELLDFLSRYTPDSSVYELDAKRNLEKINVNVEDFRDLPVMNRVFATMPDVLKIGKRFRPLYFAALVIDVCKVANNGVFAHTNFMRIPLDSSSTVTDSIKSSIPPEDILNTFEPEVETTTLKSFYEKVLGIPFVETKKRKYFVKEVGGKKRIAVEFVDANSNEEDLEFRIEEDDRLAKMCRLVIYKHIQKPDDQDQSRRSNESSD